MRPSRMLLPLLLLMVAPAQALAAHAPRETRTRAATFSVQGLEDSIEGDQVLAELCKYPGVRTATFDHVHAEIHARLATGVADMQICEMIQKLASGLRAVPGGGQGGYEPLPEYPPGTDVRFVTRDGSRVGPLERYAVRGHTTVFDVYAIWCAPCRALDARLQALVLKRPGVAIRKLDVVSFDSPLAHELGAKLSALPHVIVIGADGRRRDFDGADYDAMAAVYGWPK